MVEESDVGGWYMAGLHVVEKAFFHCVRKCHLDIEE